MPSALPGFTSGGEPLVSGNPFSGRPYPVTGVTLVLDNYALSGLSGAAVYVSFSGGLTIQSGGGQSSGGTADGWPIYPGQPQSFPVSPNGLANVYLGVAASFSGKARVYWYPEGRV